MILSKFTRLFRPLLAARLACLLVFAGTALAQTEVVVIKRQASLRDAPAEDARRLTALPVQTAVTRLGDRQGPWIKVRMADGSQGWIHIFDVSSVGAQQGSGSGSGSGSGTGNIGVSALRSISGFFNKSSIQPQGGAVATSTLGIRGLGAENLASAQPDMAGLAQADALRQDAVQARQFASVSMLVSRPVDALPLPVAPVAAPADAAGRATFPTSDR